MNNSPLEKFRADLKQIKLSDAEKIQMQQSILGTVRPESSWYTNILPRLQNLFRQKYALPLGLVIAITVVGTPLTYAAQQSGPGDWLYSMEISIVEPVEELLYFDTERQSEYYIERLHERLGELQTSTSDELSQEISDEISISISDHATEILEINSEQSPIEQIDNLIEVAALLENQEELLIAAGSDSEEIAELENIVEEEVDENISEVLLSLTQPEQDDLITSELKELHQLMVNNVIDSEDQLLWQELQNDNDDNSFSENFHHIIEIKTSILAQQFETEIHE